MERAREIVTDVSAILAVLLNEPSRANIERVTTGANLAAPGCVRWEVGNALYSAVKRDRIDASKAAAVYREFEQIPIRILKVDIEASIHIAAQERIPTYDAYYLQCADAYKRPLLTLDNRMRDVAQALGIRVLEEGR